MDLSQFEDSFTMQTGFEPEQLPIIADFAHFMAIVPDIEFFSFENSFDVSCDFG